MAEFTEDTEKTGMIGILRKEMTDTLLREMIGILQIETLHSCKLIYNVYIMLVFSFYE